jgi:hypothetical protein
MHFVPVTPSMPKCYAYPLGNCSSQISREHVFTEAVFGQGGPIGIQGYPKIPDSFIGLASATSKILCRYHNSALSPLDAEAKKLSDALGEFHQSYGNVSVVLEGPKIERWLLKVAIGYVAAGHTPLGRRYPSLGLVRALYGELRMTQPFGMYTFTPATRWWEYTEEVLFRELTATHPEHGERIFGAFVALHGLPFLFSFGGIGDLAVEAFLVRPDGTSHLDPYDTTKAMAKYHPAQVVLSSEDQTKRLVVVFAWP